MTPDEANLVIEGFWDRKKLEDKILAHYAAINLSIHVPKNKPKPEAAKLQFFQKSEEEEAAEVTNISTAQQREQVREILRKRNQQAR